MFSRTRSTLYRDSVLALFLSLSLSFSQSSVPLAFADEGKSSEERVRHYQAKAPLTADSAVKTFRASLEEIGALLAVEPVDVAKLEKVHQISYTLEAAAEKLVEQDKSSAEYKALLESAVDLHEASEDHEAAVTKQSFEKISAIFKKISS